MRNARTLCLIAVFFYPGLRAQPPRDFEAASVKISLGEAGAYLSGGPGSGDPTNFTFVGARLGALLRRAYGIQSFQLVAPSGLPDSQFDIHAKVPPGASETEFDEMLRRLLEDRFALRAHREARELPGYELTLAKGGPKLRPAEHSSTPPSADIAVGRLTPIRDSQGLPRLPPGRNARLVFRLPDGRFRYSGRMQSMADIVEMCSRELNRPVTERTGLNDLYDFDIDFNRLPDEPSPGTDIETPFLTAIQAQLGLRLVSKKAPVEVIVVDSIAKKPSEN